MQRVGLPGVWLERARLRGDDRQLLDSALAGERREALIDSARELCAGHALAPLAGCTSPSTPLAVLRALALRVEPAMELLQQVWARWREVAWNLTARTPRAWRT